MAGLIDIAKELAKLDKEEAKAAKDLERTLGKLGNDKFLGSAPPEVIAKEQEKELLLQTALAKIKESRQRLAELAALAA